VNFPENIPAQIFGHILIEKPSVDMWNLCAGELVSIQTSMFRFSSRHCHLDAERSFWMISDTSEVHVCYYFTVFYLTSATSVRGQSAALPIHELREEICDYASEHVQRCHRFKKVGGSGGSCNFLPETKHF